MEADDIGRDPQIRCALAGRRNQSCRQPARDRKAYDQCRKKGVAPFTVRGEAASDSSQEDGDKGGAFHQRIANWQLLAPQVVRKDPVFDGPEQGRKDAEPEQCDIQQRE